MKRLLLAATAALSLTSAQAAWADATQLNPKSLTGGDQTDFSTAAPNGVGGYSAMTKGGTTVQFYPDQFGTVDSTGASFTSGLEFWQGDPFGSTSAFANALFTLDMSAANSAIVTVYTDGFSNAFNIPVALTAGDNTLAFGAINGETLSGVFIQLGASAFGTSELTSLAFNAQPNGAVPEPATWAMMLLGFGTIGFTVRWDRKQRRNSSPQFA